MFQWLYNSKDHSGTPCLSPYRDGVRYESDISTSRCRFGASICLHQTPPLRTSEMASEKMCLESLPPSCLNSDYFLDKCVLLACMNSVQATADVELFDLMPLLLGSLLLQRNQRISSWVGFQPLSHFIFCLN